MTENVWLEGLLGDAPSVPLNEKLSAWREGLPESLREAVNRIATKGGGVWLVGGAVRQALLERDQHDYDLATTLLPEEICNIFPKALETGKRFGTITVRIEGFDEMFEVTTLRTESEYGDGRRPDIVDFGDSLSVDLSRRDFTINAIAIDLGRKLIHDPFGGSEDLENQRLKAVGQARQRLSEDGLRVLRGYRFMDQGERGVWMPDDDLASALREHQSMLEKVANERIWVEFGKILRGSNASNVLERMRQDGILSRILPGWDADTALQHAFIPSTSDSDICRMVLLAAEIPHARWRVIEHDLRTLTLSNQQRKKFMTLHQLLGHLPDSSNEAELRRYRAGVGVHIDAHLSMEDALQPGASEAVGIALKSLPNLAAGDEPLLDGHAIASATGLPMGRRLGRLKSWLHRMQIELNLRNEQEVLALLDVIDWAGGDADSWPGPSWP